MSQVRKRRGSPDVMNLGEAKAADGPIKEAAANPRGIPIERARVLVVDDDERNLLAITHVLEEVADVVVANSGAEALRQLLRHEFAVILLDVYMPDMDGYETARLIRAREQTKRIPIVFLSAVNKETEHLLRGYSMGAVDYVFKPVEPTVLRCKVAVFVDLYNMTKEIQRKAEDEQRLLDANLRANAERLRAEQELRMAEHRQAAIIQSLPIILYLQGVHEIGQAPKYMSGDFEAMTGFDIEVFRRNPIEWVQRVHPDDQQRAAEVFLGPPTRTRSVEYRWRRADGTYRHFLDQAVLLRDVDGEPLEYAGTLLDVSDRRELESQLNQVRKMDAIGQLTGGIAHDFNNLLAAVLGGLGMIERRVPLEDEQRRILGMTRHAAEQGAELVKHLLAFSRRQKLEPAAIDVATLATSVTDLMTHTLGGMVELKWEREKGLRCVYADAAQLELALMNLIINARDAMPEGGTVTVRASCREVSDDASVPGVSRGDYVVLAVVDTGCGIAPELLEQVMEPFFTTKAVGKGTGLGLSMVYGFAKQSGGAIRVESEVGMGTTVEIWLPAVDGDSVPAPCRPSEPRREGKADNAPLIILLVDDHDGVRATTAALLEDLGHKVVQANEGAEALDMIRRAPEAYDLVLSDYAMPRLSGAELIRQVRSIRPSLPAAIITGYAEPERAVLPEHDIPVLTKPFSGEQLQGLLQRAHANG